MGIRKQNLMGYLLDTSERERQDLDMIEVICALEEVVLKDWTFCVKEAHTGKHTSQKTSR